MTDPFLRKFALAFTTFLVTWVTCANADENDEISRKLPAALDRKVDFVAGVQPILQRACVRCHGAEKQKGEYRLDVRETALRGGESYAPNIVPGNSASSPLIRFVAGVGDLVMPPEGTRLTPDEISLLRAWIDQGAIWPDEAAGKIQDKRDLWSLKPLVRPPVPTVEKSAVPVVPIDAFIRARLAERGFPFSPDVDRRKLIRRVSYDLTGLPPTPDEVESFVADSDPKAYERLVDRLLESPRYGERWARHWLDAAHFAETHGNDQDRIREHAWPYRDYLISALNDDTPYSRFIQEQIAGDVLFPEKPSATAALGFLAAGPWDESSLRDIREDTLDRQIARYLDRDDMLATVMNNVSSLTVQCARCHDHKFDPISQHDYYALQAVFSGVERANRKYDADPEVHRQRKALKQRKRDREQRSPDVMALLLSPEAQQQVAHWERQRRSSIVEWHVVDPESFTSSDGATLTKLADCSVLSGGLRPEMDTVTIVSGSLASCIQSRPDQKTNSEQAPSSKEDAKQASVQVTAIRLEVLTDDSLPLRGPGRQDNGNLHLSEFEVFVDDRVKPEKLINPTADFNQQDWEIAKSIDEKEATAWGIHPKEGMSHRAVFELKQAIPIADKAASNSDGAKEASDTATRLRFVLRQRHGRAHLIGRMRISLTTSPAPINADALPDALTAVLNVPADKRSDDQRRELTLFQQLDEVNRGLSQLPKENLVYAAASDFDPDGSLRPPPSPRPIHILRRGDIRHPGDEVLPGALKSVSSLPSNFEIPAGSPESLRRAALANWLIHKGNPLTWRSIVNRVWYHHFGRGLVGTLNDFGHMGESPSHPELLDWLAVEFRDGNQSLKSLHRMILNSQTYRQRVDGPMNVQDKSSPSSGITDPREKSVVAEKGKQDVSPAYVRLDADNRMLWRMNRTRLDAECVRDSVLAISGRLDLRMGGPSDRQFDLQPGIHVTPRVDYAKFDQSSELGRRRSIYRFLFRTLPDPFMESLDCPSGDLITPTRSTSVTVQQALALWNDVFIANQCEQIASRIQRDVASQNTSGLTDAESRTRQIELAVRLTLCRRATDREITDFSEYTNKHGLANLCRLLLNSNEFLFVD